MGEELKWEIPHKEAGVYGNGFYSMAWGQI